MWACGLGGAKRDCLHADAGLLACLRALPVRLIEAAPREPAWRQELHILHRFVV